MHWMGKPHQVASGILEHCNNMIAVPRIHPVIAQQWSSNGWGLGLFCLALADSKLNAAYIRAVCTALCTKTWYLVTQTVHSDIAWCTPHEPQCLDQAPIYHDRNCIFVQHITLAYRTGATCQPILGKVVKETHMLPKNAYWLLKDRGVHKYGSQCSMHKSTM